VSGLNFQQKSAEESNQIVVWSLIVRLIHWLVAILVFINFINDTGWWHRFIGYLITALVFLRLVYGLFNRYKCQPVAAAYASRLWWPSFADIKQHMNELKTGHVASRLGHNPLGQLGAYIMWALITGLALTGWLARTDMFWGEDWPVEIHHWLSDSLQGFIFLHISATILMSRLQKQNLVVSMIHGRKAKSK